MHLNIFSKNGSTFAYSLFEMVMRVVFKLLMGQNIEIFVGGK